MSIQAYRNCNYLSRGSTYNWWFYLEVSAVRFSQHNAVVAGQRVACGGAKDLGAGVQVPLQIAVQIQDLGSPICKMEKEEDVAVSTDVVAVEKLSNCCNFTLEEALLQTKMETAR